MMTTGSPATWSNTKTTTVTPSRTMNDCAKRRRTYALIGSGGRSGGPPAAAPVSRASYAGRPAPYRLLQPHQANVEDLVRARLPRHLVAHAVDQALTVEKRPRHHLVDDVALELRV